MANTPDQPTQLKSICGKHWQLSTLSRNEHTPSCWTILIELNWSQKWTHFTGWSLGILLTCRYCRFCLHAINSDYELKKKKKKPHKILCSHPRRKGKELIFDLPQVADWQDFPVAKVNKLYLHVSSPWMPYTDVHRQTVTLVYSKKNWFCWTKV